MPEPGAPTGPNPPGLSVQGSNAPQTRTRWTERVHLPAYPAQPRAPEKSSPALTSTRVSRCIVLVREPSGLCESGDPPRHVGVVVGEEVERPIGCASLQHEMMPILTPRSAQLMWQPPRMRARMDAGWWRPRLGGMAWRVVWLAAEARARHLVNNRHSVPPEVLAVLLQWLGPALSGLSGAAPQHNKQRWGEGSNSHSHLEGARVCPVGQRAVGKHEPALLQAASVTKALC